MAIATLCYCDGPFHEIFEDIVNQSIPPDALTSTCCWRRICRIRGLYRRRIDDETWREICRKRGYLRARQNSRGL